MVVEKSPVGKQPTPSLESILDRLQRTIDERPFRLPKHIQQRAAEVETLIPDFIEEKEESTQALQQAYRVLQKHYSEGQEYSALKQTKERFENLITAYLFAKSRAFVAEGQFDSEKEHRQIRAVAALLSGYHVHMGTGEGKSSVVFPIATIVEVLSSQKKEAILSTVNDSLLSELNRHLLKLTSLIAEVLTEEVEIELFEREGEESDTGFSEQFAKEALLTGKYSEESKKKIRDNYWRLALLQAQAGKEDKKEKIWQSKGKPRVVLVPERELVFAFMQDSKSFLRQAPTIFMDEAHVPYDRGTPYEITHNELYYSPEDIQETTFQWLFDFLVIEKMREIGFSNLFELDQGRYQLKEEALDEIEGLRLEEITIDDLLFKRATRIISRRLGVAEDELPKLKQAIFSLWQDNLPKRFKANPEDDPPGDPLQDRIRSVAEIVAELHAEEGLSYIFDKNRGDVLVRDSYLGWLLKGHRFDPRVELLLHALHAEFTFIPLAQKAERTIRFQSFIAACREKLRCASGTLLYPDILSGRISKTAFASFLEQATGRKVVLITAPERKEVPIPEILETEQEARESLLLSLKETSGPSLVVCWREEEAKELAAWLREKGGRRVGVVLADTTEEQEKELYRQLADGELDTVVSSGKAGVGVDIKSSDGSFPDLKVALYNLPESQLQVIQALGRRRLPGSNFFWVIAESALAEPLSHFDLSSSVIERFLGAVDVESLLQSIEKSKETPRKRLEVVVQLLQQLEGAKSIDDEFVVVYDHFIEVVQKRAQWLLRQKAKAVITDLDAQHLEWLIDEFGLPEFLYWYPLAEIAFIHDAFNIRDLVENRLAHRLGLAGGVFSRQKTEQETLFAEWIEEWFRGRLPTMRELTSIVWSGGRLKTASYVYFSEAPPGWSKGFIAKEDDKSGFGFIEVQELATGKGKKILARSGDDGKTYIIVAKGPDGLGYISFDDNNFTERELEIVPLIDFPNAYILYSLSKNLTF